MSFPSASFVFLLALPVSLTARAQNPPSASQQILPAVPPALDPGFWGQPHHPYVLKMLVTKTSLDGTTPPQAHSSEENVYRDSTGRVRTETFYDNGRPMGVALQDPDKITFTFMHLVEKSAIVMPVFTPPIPPPGKGWSVERLPPRVIAGFPAEGLRFTRTIPSAAAGTGAPVTVVEDDWISTQLGVVLEQTLRDPRTGIDQNRYPTRAGRTRSCTLRRPGRLLRPASRSVHQVTARSAARGKNRPFTPIVAHSSN